MDIVIVCHTEFGFLKEGHIIFAKEGGEGVSKGVANLLAVAKQHHAKITFAVCPEVAEFFPKESGHEIGLHVHAGWEKFRYHEYEWYVGDSWLRKHCKQSKDSTNLSDYSYEEQEAMIRKGKEKLEEMFHVTPRVFVAGRWALNNDTVRALVENGFTHDCSAIPHSKANYDWSRLPRIALPYHPSSKDYQKEGSLQFLIVPVSQGLFGIPTTIESARKAGFPWLKACFQEYYSQKVPVFHIALHSPAMVDPFYINTMNSFLKFIAQHPRINFRFASEIKGGAQTKITPNVLPYAFAVNPVLVKSAAQKFIRIFNS